MEDDVQQVGWQSYSRSDLRKRCRSVAVFPPEVSWWSTCCLQYRKPPCRGFGQVSLDILDIQIQYHFSIRTSFRDRNNSSHSLCDQDSRSRVATLHALHTHDIADVDHPIFLRHLLSTQVASPEFAASKGKQQALLPIHAK
jgi:hypothetical protein